MIGWREGAFAQPTGGQQGHGHGTAPGIALAGNARPPCTQDDAVLDTPHTPMRDLCPFQSRGPCFLRDNSAGVLAHLCATRTHYVCGRLPLSQPLLALPPRPDPMATTASLVAKLRGGPWWQGRAGQGGLVGGAALRLNCPRQSSVMWRGSMGQPPHHIASRHHQNAHAHAPSIAHNPQLLLLAAPRPAHQSKQPWSRGSCC